MVKGMKDKEGRVKNPIAFTCIGKGHGAPAVPATRKEWEELRKAPWLAEMCRRIEAGDEQLKHRLPVWTPMCAEFKNNHRAKADAVRPLPRLMLDFDEKGHSREILEKALQLNEQGRWKILLVEESVRRGTHVLIALPEGMTPQEAQERFSADVGFKADPSLKDVSRCIYMVTEEHTLWVSPSLFRSSEVQECRSSDNSFDYEECRRQECRSVDNSFDSEKQKESASSASSASEKLEYHGLSSSEIVAKYWELNNDGQPPTQGDRNTKIFDLACSLRHIFNFDRELLNRAIPNYDGFPQQEKMQCIDNALREPRKYMPMKLTKVLQALKAEHSTPLPWEGQGGGSGSFPPMPKKLPPLIALLVSRTPDIYKAAVAHAVFPPLGTHLHRVTFRYIDNVAHEATLMNVLMAGTGAGKDCISQPINYIMADIRLRDEENLRREREWKNEVNSKGANKDKRKRPEGLVIQEIDADMTNPAFVMRTAEADGHFLYTKMNEIDQFDALRGSGRGGQQFQIMCLAFDPGNRYGQTRVGAGSVTEKVTIRFNWNASTTIQKGRRYFRSVLTDGPVSRINFCTIPEREIGSEMPVYGTYDEAFAEELRPYIERLTKATGEVECPEAYRLAMKLKEECADRARLTQSRVYENLSFRANVIAYLKACVLYVAHGCKWSKAIEEFVRWSLEYDLWCKMEFFGADIEESMSEGEAARRKPGPRNLLEMLPDTFTQKEALDVRRMAGIGGGEKEARNMLAVWKSRKYVLQITDNSYQKVTRD